MGAMNMPAALLLGIHPGNGHISISNYTGFCLQYLPSQLPEWSIKAIWPGAGLNPGSTGKGVRVNKHLARYQNYVEWPIRLSSSRADVLHVMDQNLSWYKLFMGSGKKVITVHDLIYYLIAVDKFPDSGLPYLGKKKAISCAKLLRTYDELICVSKNTADDLIREIGISHSKIHVIPNIVPAEFACREHLHHVLRRNSVYGSPEIALLHVGKASPYKNRISVLRVLSSLVHLGRDAKLVITGGALTSEERSYVEGEGVSDRILLHTPKDRTELADLYAAADMLLFPSTYEGFGWPPIEAMACGCPVISSTLGSLRETIGDAAIQIEDPLNIAIMVDQVLLLSRDALLRAHLVERGLAHVLKFEPSRVMSAVAEVYRSANPDRNRPSQAH